MPYICCKSRLQCTYYFHIIGYNAIRIGNNESHRNRRGDPGDHPRCTVLIAIGAILVIAPIATLIVGFGTKVQDTPQKIDHTNRPVT
jgi:hypothetical protein